MFAQYKPSRHDRIIHGLISDCYYNRKKDCFKRLSPTIGNKDFEPFKNLQKIILLKIIKEEGRGFKYLDVYKNELKDRDLIKLINNSGAQSWLKKNFKVLEERLKELVSNKPNVLCQIKEQEDFVKKQLKKIASDEDRFALNFSKHPCGIDTYIHLKDLKKERDKINSSHFYYDYKYKILQKKAALRIYKSIKRKKTSALWSAIFKSNAYTQELVIRNLFYRKEYTKLSYLEKVNFKQVSPESLMYIAKSFLYTGEEKKLEELVNGLSFKRSEWTEESLLSLAISQIRREKLHAAKSTLDKLLKYHVNLKLTGLYWKWVVNQRLEPRKENKENKENKEIVKQIENQYAFTYYGIKILTQEKGANYFDKHLNSKKIKVNRLSLEDKEVKKLLVYYSGGFKELFLRHFNSVKEKMSAEELALFAMVFERLGKRLHAIRTLKTVWESNEALRVQPFFGVSYPQPFRNKIKKSVFRLKYVQVPLVLSIARQESAFNPRALSVSGARGLMQVISLTGKEIARYLRLKSYRGARSLFNPETNLKIGAKYLDRLLVSSKGYLPYALASYNAGPGNLYRWSSLRPGVQELRKGLNHREYKPINELWIEELPWSETRFYVKAVLRNLGLYRLLLDQKGSFICDFYWMCGQDGKKL